MRMKLVDGIQVPMTVEEEAARNAEETAWLAGQASRDALAARTQSLESAIGGDSVIQTLRTMTAAQFDAWWDANVTNAAQAIGVLKRLIKLIIFKLL